MKVANGSWHRRMVLCILTAKMQKIFVRLPTRYSNLNQSGNCIETVWWVKWSIYNNTRPRRLKDRVAIDMCGITSVCGITPSSPSCFDRACDWLQRRDDSSRMSALGDRLLSMRPREGSRRVLGARDCCRRACTSSGDVIDFSCRVVTSVERQISIAFARSSLRVWSSFFPSRVVADTQNNTISDCWVLDIAVVAWLNKSSQVTNKRIESLTRLLLSSVKNASFVHFVDFADALILKSLDQFLGVVFIFLVSKLHRCEYVVSIRPEAGKEDRRLAIFLLAINLRRFRIVYPLAFESLPFNS